MYADIITRSMRAAIDETERRRERQQAYNAQHGITPQSIIKQIDDVLSSVYERDYSAPPPPDDRFHTQAELDAYIGKLQQQMRDVAANLDFEKAAALRDEIKRLRNRELGLTPARKGSDAA